MSDEGNEGIEHPQVAYSDERGEITDLVQGEEFDSAALITTNVGAVRGNHYHEHTYQVTYIAKGKLRVVTQMPGGPVVERVAVEGDLVRTPPQELHAFQALEPTTMFVITRGPRGGQNYEADTYRLDDPLISP